ncbi:ferric reductase-like transmembrane domain-containing protein [Nguyenibacter sp. L1]|uniref:ferric reductase-like transmembrane domain-containing protein n=1 Tax=Nguyenibacter sp. L1 TaxID=3049350 RepID=UPI002B4A7A77|nr:ferric reductase-like transmembrane domain-containing protein [Nguyenibacter sp. L1]WRH87252.1 ferric reductase-like transmembrane domain-containing protein [Nguyenibacter sp. L1]
MGARHGRQTWAAGQRGQGAIWGGSIRHDRAASMILLLPLAVLAALLSGVVFCWRPLPAMAPAWDGAMACGVAAYALLLFLFVLTGRPLRLPFYDGKFFIRAHRLLGWLAVLLPLLHALLLLWAEPLTLRYLLPGAPAYMLAGGLAAGGMALLGGLAMPAARAYLWRNAASFRRAHGAAALMLLGLATVHIAAARLHVTTRGQVAALAVTALVCAVLPWVGRHGRLPPVAPGRRRRRATSAIAVRLSLGVGVASLGLSLLYAEWLGRWVAP